MLLDVLSDRGFQASYSREVVEVPVRFDTATGGISTEARSMHRFCVRFEAAGVRDGQALKVRGGGGAGRPGAVCAGEGKYSSAGFAGCISSVAAASIYS